MPTPILLTCTYHNADCNTYNSLIASKVLITPKKIHHSKKKGHSSINTSYVKTKNGLSNSPASWKKLVEKYHDVINNRPQVVTPKRRSIQLSYRPLWKEEVGKCQLV